MRLITGKRKRKKNFLIIKLCCLGDGALTLYSLRYLKEKFPGSKIDVLASERTREIFELSEYTDSVFTLPISGRRGFREIAGISEFFRILKQLLPGNYGSCFNLDIYYRFTDLFVIFSGAPVRRGFECGFLRLPIYTLQSKREKDVHEAFSIAAVCDVPRETICRSPLVFNIPEAETERVESLIGCFEKDKTAVFCTGSSPNWPEKKWPGENFASLARMLAERGWKIIFTGAEEDFPASYLSENFPEGAIVNLCGQTSVAGLIAVLKDASIFVGNDSGPAHIAGTVGIWQAVIFGPTNHKKWAPFYKGAVFKNDCSCRPCYYLGTMPVCANISERGPRCLDIRPHDIFKAVIESFEIEK
ncbi:MAG: glycosyltransferase family 9 protein [Fibrobacterota bacterium]